MAPLNKEVLFGLIRNCGNRELKIVLKINREEEVKKRRQFVWEDVAS